MARFNDAYVLERVAGAEVPVADAEVSELLATAAGVLARLSGSSGRATQRGVLDLLLRAIEMRLLADPELIGLAHFYASFAGRIDEIVSERVLALTGVPPPPPLLDHIKECLRSHSQERVDGESESIRHEHFTDALAARLASGRRQLRCEICGYHFRKEDMGAARREAAADMGVEFAEVLHPLRQADPYKPLLTGGRVPKSLTEVTLDHEVPRSGWGPTTSANLVVLCGLCNGGKSIYRRPLESLSPVIAGSLMAFPRVDDTWPTKRLAVTSALRASGGRCSKCGSDRRHAELSVRAQKVDGVAGMWFVPWCMDVMCYACISAA